MNKDYKDNPARPVVPALSSKDISKIPIGYYCYTVRTHSPNEFKFNPEGLPIIHIERCPYFSFKTFNGVEVTWCSFLNKGSIDGSSRDINDPARSEEIFEDEYSKLLTHFGSEESLEDALPLFLLFDGVKECGINES